MNVKREDELTQLFGRIEEEELKKGRVREEDHTTDSSHSSHWEMNEICMNILLLVGEQMNK